MQVVAKEPGSSECAWRAFDLAALLVAAEHVGDFGACQARGAVFGGGLDLVRRRVAKAVAEDPAGGVGAEAPDRDPALPSAGVESERAVRGSE